MALAKKYGLDVLATEKANAQERADLITSALKSQIGSLQDILTSMTSGDLFEGSAGDRYKALLDQIDVAKSDAAAGKDGAAATLSQLYSQLLSTSKDAFGTAGTEYQADRTSVSTGAQSVIAAATARITSAAGGTANDAAAVAAVQAQTALVNEGNDMTAITNSRLAAIEALLAKAVAGSTPAPDLTSVTRFGNLT